MPLNVYNQKLQQIPASEVGQPGPKPTGRKKALLVGINYFGTEAELRGCINDVQRMRSLLIEMYGFPSDNIRVLTDDSRNSRWQPTRSNILRELRWLSDGVKPGDILFFHYSGHGAQQEDPNYAEEDGFDETVCPVDFQSAGMIVDDEIFDLIVAPLPAGAKLTALMDCCHSGTGLDLPFTWESYSGRWVEETNPCHSAGDVLLISGCQDEQTSADGGGSYGKPMGAMTSSLCNTLERYPSQNHAQLLENLRMELRRGGFDQIPQLTASQQFDIRKPFSPVSGIEGNSNPTLGRHFRKEKHPRREGLLTGGLGQMLAASALGFLAADLAGDAIGGLVMGGADMAGDAVEGGAGFFDGLFGGGDGDGGGFFGGLLGGGDGEDSEW